MSLSVERPEDCPTRISVGIASGFVAGSLFGAVASNWGDVPLVIRDKPWPALLRTGSVMMQYGATLGLVGLAFSTVDVSPAPASAATPKERLGSRAAA